MLLSLFLLVLGLGRTPEGVTRADTEQVTATAPAQSQPPTQAPAGSSAPAEAKEPPTPPHTGLRALGRGVIGDLRHLPAKENLYLSLVGGAVAAALHPADQSFNGRLRSHYDVVNTAFAPAKYLGNTPEQAAFSLGTYAYGRIFKHPKVSHLGMDLLRAQLVTEILVQPIKFAAQRERPDLSDSHSFPSGHAAVTFATATVLERHLGWRRSFLAYALATYVAASRLHDNRHYLSDVAFGAAVGTIAGRTVTQHGRDNWSMIPVDVPGGVAVLAVRTGF
jgi:hypothetical protein